MVSFLSSWKHQSTYTTTSTTSTTTTNSTQRTQRTLLSKRSYIHQEQELCIDAPSPHVGYHASFPQDGKLLRPPRTTRTPYWDWIHTTAPRTALVERDDNANLQGSGPYRHRPSIVEEVPVRETLKGEDDDDEYAFYHTHPERMPSRNKRTSFRRSHESESRRASVSPPPNQRDSLLTMVDGATDANHGLHHYDVDDDGVGSFESDGTALTNLSMEIIHNPEAATDGFTSTFTPEFDDVMKSLKTRPCDAGAKPTSPGYPLSPADSEFMKGILCLPSVSNPSAQAEYEAEYNPDVKSGRAYSRSCPPRIVLDEKRIPGYGEESAAEMGKRNIFLHRVRKSRSRLSIFRFLS